MGRTKRQRLQRQRADNKRDSQELAAYLPALLRCLSSKGWRNDTQLTPRYFPATGRGLCSKQPIQTGESLIKLPLQALLTIATIEADSDFKEIFDESRYCKDLRIPFQSLMAFYLLYHKQRAAESPLAPMLNSIPTTFTTPYFCPLNELHFVPEEILEKTVEQNRKIRASFKNLQSVCKDEEYFQQHFILADFKWIYFAVNSRCVYVPSREFKQGKGLFDALLSDETNLAMAPFLDLFNHSDKVETRAELVPRPTETKTKKKQFDYVVTLHASAERVHPRYSQLFISYGQLPNLKLLTEYGFILPHNQHDYFEFSLHDIEGLIRVDKTFAEHTFHRNKFKFIRDHNLSDQMFGSLRDGISHNLRVVLHLLFKEQSHFPNVLNQVAFGDVDQFDDIQDVLEKLFNYKIEEYKNFIAKLMNLTQLSESGLMVVEYMKESVRYLQELLESNLN